ncbi:ABC transporter permease [Corynebacterium timonense]|uniref:Putative ABC transport system permease protein n=1 Tax=Corynebacterium timonense TaxID=441500 RepID=A0A1H1UYY3_9CORY|nr:ABC transporter permease [Corynebacterium timonense]SDS77732.1 putative ABC transport system permease protein [Corynebacterium timonense]
MSLRESIRLAATSLRVNKMRAVLTLMGVIIGIAAVVAIMTLGKGMQKQLLNDLEQFGINDVFVEVSTRTNDDGPAFTGGLGDVPPSALITPAMVDDLRGYLGASISGIALDAGSDNGRITRGLNEGHARLMYTNSDYVEMQHHPITAGRLLTPEDIDGDRNVTIISPEIVATYFNGDPQSAIGQFIDADVNGRFVSLQVVGAYGRADVSSPLVGTFEDASMYVPYPAQARLGQEPVEGFRGLQIRAAEGTTTDEIRENITTWADRAYADDPDYHAAAQDTKSDVDRLNQTMALVSMVISAIGGISLLVGGIGVMNIMLVSVTERTREIGIRMALGATRRAIRTQFVTEAMMICLLGGALGVALGTAIGMLGTSFIGAMVLPPVGAALIALLFSLAIGLFFGWYPASRAARMRPIEALRYE